MTVAPQVDTTTSESARPIERVVVLAPWLLVAYVALQLLIRLLLSSNLEADEAQFVGQVDFRWGYGNSQGPLYNWIVGLVLASTGSWPVSVAFTKHFFLAATYLLQYGLVRRLTGSSLAAAAGAFALLLVPQILVLSEITLAQSVMVQAVAVGTLHALVQIIDRATPARFVWLVVTLTFGILGKYNFLILVAAIAVATIAIPERASAGPCFFSLRPRSASPRCPTSFGPWPIAQAWSSE